MTATFTPLVELWQEPCDATACGDRVLIQRNDDAIRVLLVDASGHGPRAAKAAMAFEHIARPALGDRITSETFRSWNCGLSRLLAPSQFVAVTVIEIDTRRCRCVVWNAGNPAPRLVREPARPLRKLGEYGLPLGAFDAASYEPPTPMLLTFRPDDELIIFSDGLTDQRRGNEQFGDDRVQLCLKDSLARSVDSLDELRRAIRVFHDVPGWDDDLTVLRITLTRASESVRRRHESEAA